MNLLDLQQEIPYKWRVQSFSKNKPKAACVAYIDARDVMDLLDKVCSPENWQDEYKMVGDQMFAGIGIKVDNEWVWKWDTGSETAVEKEKGEVSDSFKRAAVRWGVGRFLYRLDIKYVNANKIKGDHNTETHAKYPYVVDNNGKRVWDVTELINGKQPTTPPKPPTEAPVASQEVVQACSTCNVAISDAVMKYSMDHYKKPLCRDHQ